MLVVNGFDLWQRDTFFSAAEEVQRSADIMESAYRTWARQKIEGLKPIHLDELCRELQTALGTAKWQLEEFGKAVIQSYRSREDDITIARHRQFIDAIGNQISRVELSLKQSFNEQGKTPLRWVTLDDEESDDLAAFLSGPKQCVSKTSADIRASTNSSPKKNNCVKDTDIYTDSLGGRMLDICSLGPQRHIQESMAQICAQTYTNSKIKISNFSEIMGNIDCEIDRTSGSNSTWSSSNRGEWKIVIDPEEDHNSALAPILENSPKDKGSKSLFWKQRSKDWLEAKGATLSCSRLRGIQLINQILGRSGVCRRQLQAPIPSKLSSLKFKLLLMLTLFLIVPFLVYSA